MHLGRNISSIYDCYMIFVYKVGLSILQFVNMWVNYRKHYMLVLKNEI